MKLTAGNQNGEASQYKYSSASLDFKALYKLYYYYYYFFNPR